MKKSYLSNIITRYLLLVILGLGNLWLFYKILTPLTLYAVNTILSLFSKSSIHDSNTLLFEGIYVKIVEACVAGSAYYLFLILNLSTPMVFKKRIKNILFLFASFFLINILRIAFFVLLFYYNFPYFVLYHELTWYFGSTLMVVGIWFLGIYLFKITEIPFISDYKLLRKEASKRKK